MTQGELVKAIRAETSKALSQSYISQIESGARPHLTNTTRLLLAQFFKVHPGYLVDDPEGYHAELLSDLRAEATLDAKLDAWLVGGAERFRRDPDLHNALITLAMHPDSRACLLLLEGVLETPGLAERLAGLLRPGLVLPGEGSAATLSSSRSNPIGGRRILDQVDTMQTPHSSAPRCSGPAISSAPSDRKSSKGSGGVASLKLSGASHAR